MAQQGVSSPRIGLVVSSLALSAVLLIGFKSPDELGLAAAAAKGVGDGTAVPATVPPATGFGGRDRRGPTVPAGGADGTGGSNGASGTPSSGAAGPTHPPAGGTAGSGSAIAGQLVQTRYGPVQVQVTLGSGGWVDVTPLRLPTGGRSGAISSYAAPILRSEALAARSASIQIVSGATYTSRAYETSLQAALDQIHA